MGKRTIVCKGTGRKKKCHYVVRDRYGRFKSWTNIGRSIAVDKRKKTRPKLKKHGYGHRGDY